MINAQSSEQRRKEVTAVTEYIDRDAFKKSVEESYCNPCKAEGKDHNGCWCRACWVDDMLNEVDCFPPADVAPVVRCGECARRNPSCDLTNTVLCTWLHNLTMPKDCFCSYGERRADNG